jgi:hypothetical protein
MTLEPRPEAFRRTLRRLKRRGCAILVDATNETSDLAACRRFLGVSPEYRRVLVVRQDGDPGERLSERVAPTDATVTVVDADDHMGPSGDVAAVGRAVLDAIDGFDEAGLGPGDLRVCVAAADALYDADAAAATEVVERVGEAVRAADGMAYFHVGDGVTETDVRGLCDVRIDVRETDTGVEQRWHLPGARATRWVPV